MSPLTPAINLQFGKNALSYQDVILLTLVNCAYSAADRSTQSAWTRLRSELRQPLLRNYALLQIIPSKRGSHSEISGM
jgi:hypothetical protein